MSISSALSNAYSGLVATSRSAETVSNNVANALTEGYSRQEVGYDARVTAGVGAGVTTRGAQRAIDPALTIARMGSDASLAGSRYESRALDEIAALLGEPGQTSALASRVAAFENALVEAQAAPDSEALLGNVLSKAKNLTQGLNEISNATNTIREKADANIARQVGEVNRSLQQIEKLNSEMRSFTMSGRSTAALEDQRQALVDKVNAIIPIRQAQVDVGEIAIYSQGGAVLLHGSARELEFVHTAMMTPDMTLASGALSGLKLEGSPIEIGVTGKPLEGGSLSVNFQVRDTIALAFNAQIDALAANLIGRLQDPSVDPTIVAGSAGLFTDNGTAYDPASIIGLAGRMGVNASVDPLNGGELWRIRDGVAAAAPGYAGDNATLKRISAALRTQQSGALFGLMGANSIGGFTEEVSSVWAAKASRAGEATASLIGRQEFLRNQELQAVGVDTDQEMQSLLMIEQAYAANARVVSTVDNLMNILLEM